MKSLSKLTLGLSVSLLLTGCSGLQTSANIKEKMEADNYLVTILTAEEYEASTYGELIPSTLGLEDYLNASKPGEEGQPGNYLHVWFFSSVDDASRFNDTFDSFMYNMESSDGAKFTGGLKYNAVYYGTKDAIKVSTLGKLF